MAEQGNILSGRPDVLLMFHEGLPDDIEADVRAHLDDPGLNLGVVRHPGGPYSGAELYLPPPWLSSPPSDSSMASYKKWKSMPIAPSRARPSRCGDVPRA